MTPEQLKDLAKYVGDDRLPKHLSDLLQAALDELTWRKGKPEKDGLYLKSSGTDDTTEIDTWDRGKWLCFPKQTWWRPITLPEE